MNARALILVLLFAAYAARPAFAPAAARAIDEGQAGTTSSVVDKAAADETIAASAPTSGNMIKGSPDSSDVSPLMGLPSDFVLFWDGTLATSFANTGEAGSELTIIRNNVRIFSSKMEIHCDLLIYDKATGLMKAWPAVGKRVQVNYMGVRGTCGYLEFNAEKNIAVMFRRPILIQMDEKGHEVETEGNVITLSRNKAGQASILVQGKKGEIKEMSAAKPASVEMRDAKKEPVVVDAPEPGEPEEITAQDVDRIPLKERGPDDKRPGAGNTSKKK